MLDRSTITLTGVVKSTRKRHRTRASDARTSRMCWNPVGPVRMAPLLAQPCVPSSRVHAVSESPFVPLDRPPLRRSGLSQSPVCISPSDRGTKPRFFEIMHMHTVGPELVFRCGKQWGRRSRCPAGKQARAGCPAGETGVSGHVRRAKHGWTGSKTCPGKSISAWTCM